jgi:hypothetical protein
MSCDTFFSEDEKAAENNPQNAPRIKFLSLDCAILISNSKIKIYSRFKVL